MGLVLVLFTNATMVTKDVAARLAQAPPSRMEITLYGATAKTFEAVTGAHHGYEKCCAGIEALLAQGIPLSLKTTLTRHNVAEVDAMRQMADNWGLPFAASWLLSGRPDGAQSEVEDCRLTVSQCIDLEAANRATATEEMEGALREIPADYRPGAFYCHAGRSSFTLGPDGRMGVCQLLPQPGERPLEIGFAGAWKEAQLYVESATKTTSACSDCDLLAHCLRCPAWSLMETGTLTEPVPYLCDIAEARKAAFGMV
jgi:radical SAM protein with 4Fe4S-binding SPASM domain